MYEHKPTYWERYPEMADLLKKRVLEGASYSKIMLEFDDPQITRNALIGKARRMGLSKPKEPGSNLAPNENGNDVVKRIQKRRVSVETLNKNGLDLVSRILKRNGRRERLKLLPEIVETIVAKITGPVHLYDVSYGQCRWIEGDPISMMFCGAAYRPNAKGLSYCPPHLRRATNR